LKATCSELPSRLVVLASEAGVLPMETQKIRQKGRLMPGRMFLVDTAQGRIVDDEELKNQHASAKPYRQWIDNVRVKLDEIEKTSLDYYATIRSLYRQKRIDEINNGKSDGNRLVPGLTQDDDMPATQTSVKP